MTTVYLDNSATTPLSAEAIAAMEEAMTCFGNPSSLHGIGQAAHTMMEKARRGVALALGLRGTRPGELIFTGSGTEASVTAILGTVYAKSRRSARRIITTNCEHPSVEETLRRLESDGFDVVRIPTTGGVLDTEAAIRALEIPTLLVTMMAVNNETGAVFDVAKVFGAAKARDAHTITHCDAVQAFCKLPVSPMALRADLMTVSAHKIHGPKGVGALCVHPDILKTRSLVPLLPGGGQEAGLRSGTENVIGIAGFGAAAVAAQATMAADVARMISLRDRLDERLVAMGVQVNRPVGDRAPHIVNLTLPDIKSQTMLNFLSARGICVSSGSACASHGQKVSASLLAHGLTARQADCSLRVSLSPRNTEADIEALCEALVVGLATLVRIRR